MAEKIVSPGVFTKEIDQSFIPAALGEVGAAIVGPTVKGPVLTPTVVSSYGEYVQTFGELIESGSDKYQYLTSHTAQEYLRQGGPLTVVRVADPAATRASATISKTGGASDSAATAAAGSLTIVGTFGQTPNDETQITVGGTEYRFIASDPDNIPADTSNVFFHITGSSTATYLDNLVAEINAASIGVTAVDGATELNLTASSAGTGGNSISVDTGSGATMSDVLTLAGGAGSSGGGDLLTLQVLGDGTIFNNTSSVGTDQLISARQTATANDHFSSGSHGGRIDNVRWEVSNVNNSKGTFTLLIRSGNDTIKKKQILETHANLSLDPESSDYILKRIGNQANTIATEDGVAYLQPVGDYPNKSKYVRVSNFPDTSKTPDYLDENGDVIVGSQSGSLPPIGSGSYNGTFDGAFFGKQIDHPFNFYENIDSTNSQGIKMSESSTGIGGSGGGYATALSILSNKDEYNFNLLFLPGVIDQTTNHSPVITQAIDMCETRGDAFLVIDNVGKTSSVATAKTNTEARNSSYAAAYYPWVQIQDNSLGTYRFVPPSVVIAGVYHFNDVVGQPWFAPAGLNRGGIDSAIQAYRKLTQGNRDDLYDSNVNPIATFPGQGVTVFGQKTTQKKASALDRVNVRRLLINVKSFISRTSRLLVFEQNTGALRDQFLNTVNPFLEQVQSNSGLNAFRVQMDDQNNTPETIDRNQLIGQIFLQPTRTAEFILLDFIVQPTGAAFPE